MVRQNPRSSESFNEWLETRAVRGSTTFESNARGANELVRRSGQATASMPLATEPPETEDRYRTLPSRPASARYRATPSAANVARKPPPENVRPIVGPPRTGGGSAGRRLSPHRPASRPRAVPSAGDSSGAATPTPRSGGLIRRSLTASLVRRRVIAAPEGSPSGNDATDYRRTTSSQM
jgi:hypothetical protein